MLILAFIIGTVIHCLGDFFLKKASIQFTWACFLAGAVLYVTTIPIWWWLLKHGKLAVISSIGAALQIALLAVVGVVIFREHLSVREICGIALAMTAILVLAK